MLDDTRLIRLKNAITNEDAPLIAELMQEFNLVIRDGKICPREDVVKTSILELSQFFNMRQMARKLMLNALYGALLNEAMRMSDERMGQSVTLTGRSIVRHMNAEVNKTITGEYDYRGISVVYADTDSFSQCSQILSNRGDMPVSDLFELLPVKWVNGEKEYAWCPDTRVMSYDPKTSEALFKNINYVYRHRVSKERWKITDQFGNEVICTGDHSIMIERDGVLMEIKPRDILLDDTIVSIREAK